MGECTWAGNLDKGDRDDMKLHIRMRLVGAVAALGVGLWQLCAFAIVEHPPENRRQTPQRPGAVVEQQ